MTYNILNKKVYLGCSSKAVKGDQIHINDTSYIVADKNEDQLLLVKRVLSSNVDYLRINLPVNNSLEHTAEYKFILTEESSPDYALINTSTFFEGNIKQDKKEINFYCVDIRGDRLTSSKRSLFYCKNPHLVIEGTQAFIIPFSDTKTWLELCSEDTSEVGDVIRALKRDIFPVFDSGRWSRSKDNSLISVDWDNHCFCVSTGSGNLHNLRPFDEIPCTCEDSQHRGFIFKCKHQISLERNCYNIFGKNLVEALADKI